MSRRLAVNVALRDEATYSTVVFEAGTSPPDWAAVQITNEKAWASDGGTASGKEPAAATPSAPAAAPPAGLEKPPSGGEGSGLGHWVAYAQSLGIDVPETATRGDVITLVEVFEDNESK